MSLCRLVSQSVEVDLLPDVLVRPGRDARDDVVVVLAAEELVLHPGSVVHRGVKNVRHIRVEHAVFFAAGQAKARFRSGRSR